MGKNMQPRPRVLIFAMILALLATLLPSSGVSAASIHVSIFTDEYDENDSDCSLREAVVAANENRPVGGCEAGSTGLDTIYLPPGSYTLSVVDNGTTDSPYKGDLDITSSLTVYGDSAAVTIIRATLLDDRIFHVNTTGSVFLRNLTIQNGKALLIPGQDLTGRGGGIFNEKGITTIDNCVVTQNLGPRAGGGIDNNEGATMYITESSIENNTSNYGGGIFNDGMITIKNSLIAGNTANIFGGGFDNNRYTSKAILINVTVALNQATTGAGIYSQSNIEITNSTIAHNTDGEGIYSTAQGFIVNSIVAWQDTNCSISEGADKFASKGYNIENHDNECHFNAPGDRDLIDPGLSTLLVMNDGYTRNYALLEDSPAVNMASNSYCPVNDQRGPFFSRADGACDIGAFEFGAYEVIYESYLPVIYH